MKRMLIACIAAAALGRGSASADIIHLKNGGTVQGEIILEGEDHVKFEFLHGSGVIAFRDIESIEREEPSVYHRRQGDYYLESKAFDDAIEEYNRVLRADPNSEEAKRGLEKAQKAKEEHQVAAKKEKIEKKKDVAKDVLNAYQQPVDLDFRGADLITVLRFLSTVAGVNIIWDEGELEGKRVEISLKGVPLIKALELVLRNQALAYKVEPHGIWVTTLERMRIEDRITTMIYNSRMGDVDRLQRIVSEFLSEDGKVIVDKRRNILFITDRASILETISRILKTID